MINALTIESMAYLGAGITHTPAGKVLFVDGAVVGDVIKPLEVVSQPRQERCLSFELLEASPLRIDARCPYAESCGACPWQVMAYETQLAWKRRFVVDALERIGRIADSEALVGECVASPQEWHYRNKVEFDTFVQDDKICLGLHEKGSQEQVAIDQCLLLPETLTQLPVHLTGALVYSLGSAQRNLVRLALRHSLTTASTELALFMRPSGVNRSLLVKTLNSKSQFSSLVRPITDSEMVERKVKKLELLAGAGYWQEKLADHRYKISAPSFFQVNSAIATSMIESLGTLIAGLDLPASAVVADLYSGAGTFTLPLAQRFAQVFAIESYGYSIRDLKRNTEEAGLADKVQAIGGDVARELAAIDQPRLALIDPPRSGLRPEARKALLNKGIEYLVYVSCNPTTLARDLEVLATDYELLSVTPFDQFPQSYHVEIMSLLKLRRRISKSLRINRKTS